MQVSKQLISPQPHYDVADTCIPRLFVAVIVEPHINAI